MLKPYNRLTENVDQEEVKYAVEYVIKAYLSNRKGGITPDSVRSAIKKHHVADGIHLDVNDPETSAAVERVANKLIQKIDAGKFKWYDYEDLIDYHRGDLNKILIDAYKSKYNPKLNSWVDKKIQQYEVKDPYGVFVELDVEELRRLVLKFNLQ